MRCFRLPKFLQKRVEPKVYGVKCPHCSYTAIMQVVEPGEENSVQNNGDEVVLVQKLPKHCPQCNGKVKIEKIPVNIIY